MNNAFQLMIALKEAAMTWICFSCFSTVDCFLNFELSRVFFVFSLFSAVCGYILVFTMFLDFLLAIIADGIIYH